MEALSENSHLNFKIKKVLWIISLALIFHAVLSYNLWFPISRTYPTVPFFDFVPIQYGLVFTSILSSLFLGSILWSGFANSARKWLLLVAIVTFGLLLLEDFNRLQVWLYIYLALLGSILWHDWRDKPTNTLSNLQFILAIVYCWTGIQKLNLQFTLDVYTWLAGILSFTKPLAAYTALGYSIGLFELVIGLCFFFPKTQNIAVCLTTLLHAAILLLLIQDNCWNTVVYPWNIVMVGLVWVLFWNNKTPILQYKNKPSLVLIVLFGILPIVDFGHYWTHELSFGMYSGVAMEGDLYFEDAAQDSCIPEVLHGKLLYQSEEESALSLDDWAMQNLNTPPISTPYSFTQVAIVFCQCLEKKGYTGGIEFSIPYRWQDKDTTYQVPCHLLLKD